MFNSWFNGYLNKLLLVDLKLMYIVCSVVLWCVCLIINIDMICMYVNEKKYKLII